MTCVHDSRVNHQVVVDEFCRTRAVGENAADGSGDEIDRLRTIHLEPVVYRRLIPKVELVARGCERRDSALLEAPHDGRADEAAMTRDEDLRSGTYRQCLCSVIANCRI